jgi:two-component system OmpR family sensor kinase
VTAVVTGCAERVRVADPVRTWRVRIADGLMAVGDEELLRRAVDNLLMNVLVHTPGDTVGTITASAAGGRVTIEVSDDGPGVPSDKLLHIFERFYRAGGPVTRSRSISPTQPARPTSWVSPTNQPRPASPPGSGLGLAIATEIASAHGGAAQAASVSPHGLRITLTLPVRQPSGPRSARELAASVS